MRAHAPFPILLALLAFVLLSVSRPATAERQKHVATQHGASHPDAHPETKSKQRDAEAKRRLAKDRQQEKKNLKQQKRVDQAAKGRKSHPVATHSRTLHDAGVVKVAHRTKGRGRASKASGNSTAVATPGPDSTSNPDSATASRVHAWMKTQKQPSADPHAGALPVSLNAATPKTDAPDAVESRSIDSKSPDIKNGDTRTDNATGTSTPPPDKPEAAKAALSAPVSVVSVVRKTPGQRPQLPPVEDVVAEPVILPTLYNKRGRLVVPPPMKGSHEILIRQNQVADDEGLDRIQNDEDLDRLRAAGLLTPIPSNAMLHVDERLPLNRRYCRPWTALFLDTLARQHYARFQSTLQLTSAVRTVEFQQQLIHRNGNAAPAEGDTASPHLTGQAIDIGKKGLSMAEIAWLRGYLLPLVQQGKVDVEEEFQQSCFHISVYRKYLPRATGRRSIASAHGDGLDVLATGLR